MLKTTVLTTGRGQKTYTFYVMKMAAVDSKSCKSFCRQKYPVKGKISSHLPKNPLSRLQYRELGGIHKHHRLSVFTQVFQKLPGRLCFSLRSLVHESILREGHVFLGFSKSGQFVLSYTLHVEQDEQTAYPVYVYRLQWWHFVPYKRLRKVSEVRLFGEEGIEQELFLTVCEWPTVDSKVVIHGYSNPCDNEEKCQCYLTITATPPIGPCDDCTQVIMLHSQHDTGYSWENPPRCLAHAFAVHTKYELAPPYPVFTPKVFLKLDGVVLVNTGDSLVALSVHIEDNHGVNGVNLFSPRVVRSESYLSSASSTASTDGECQEKTLEDDPGADSSPLSASCFPCSLPSPSHSAVQRSHPMPKDTTNTASSHVPEPHSRDKHLSTGKENLLNRQLGSPPNSSDNSERTLGRLLETSVVHAGRHDTTSNVRYETTSNNRLLHKTSLDVYNFECGTPKKDDDVGDYPEVPFVLDASGSRQAVRSVRTTLSLTTFHQTAQTNCNSEELDGVVDFQTVSDASEEQNKIFGKPSLIPRLQSKDGVTSWASTVSSQPRLLSGISILSPDVIGIGRGLALSPGFGKFDQGGSSTCSSCISSPIILQNESQCFTYSVRRYIECPGNQRPESPVDFEDDLNLAYHSLLPLEIHGANYATMRLVSKQGYIPQMPCVAVKQLTLDIEHYLGEAVKMYAEWGSRYLAFTDYDVQIVEVCPESGEVVAIVFVLIRARPPKDSHSQHVHGTSRTVPKLYQTGFKLVWNLQTGLYNTLDVGDLVEVNQAELFRTKQWHPGNKLCDSLRRRFTVPQVHHQLVNVLTNEAVLRGQSLKMLLDRQHYSAILL